MQEKGMSRAAQKKRKREKKEKSRQNIQELAKSLGDNINDNETWEDKFDAEDARETSKRPRIDEGEIFTRNIPDLSGFQDLSLLEALNLRDVKDIDAYSKGFLILSKLIQPIKIQEFYANSWQKFVLLSSEEKGDPHDVQPFGNKPLLKKILKENVLRIDEDISIMNAKSEILVDGIPRSSQDYFRYFGSGNTLQLLKPQKVDGKLVLMSKENLFYEETYSADRFIIQLEGSTVCRNPSTSMDLQQFLSLQEEEEDSIVTNILNLSRLLYIPQGLPVEFLAKETHSLVLVIYTNRENKVADLLEFIFPTAINNLKQQMNLLTSSLPPNIYSFLGVAHCENENDKFRDAFFSILKTCTESVSQEILAITDPAVDQHAKKFIMERLPVPLSEKEEKLTYSGFPNAVIYPYTQLRMVRPGIAVTVIEDGKCVVYHCMDNSRELFGNPINPLEFDLDDGPAIEALLKAYPESVMVTDLEHPSDEMDDKIGVAEALYKEGFLIISDVASQPNNLDSEDDDSDEGLL